jgi:3-phosphoshikimate 1-carboxyvinyltransferase
MSSITISHSTGILSGSVALPSSKSLSNRVLILQALSNGCITVDNLSDARDTKIMQRALTGRDVEVNIEDAGTAMRFLTAYFCATNQHKILTGTARMCERPIKVLVDALNHLGFDLKYLAKDGYPPIEIRPIDRTLLKKQVSVAGDVSSQYITALLMIAPVLYEGLQIDITTELSSEPYIAMTITLMRRAGININISGNDILVAPGSFLKTHYNISGDWSAASYWYSMVMLSTGSELYLKNMQLDDEQGDKKVIEWARGMGVVTEVFKDGILIHSSLPSTPALEYDFTDTPDLAQTMIVCCTARGMAARFKGLESLRIKETDRIAALQNELQKCGVELIEIESGLFTLRGDFVMPKEPIATYHDHRMAMAFAPLALLGPITIDEPDVVAKSYPSFWEEMKKVGFTIS